MISFVTRRLRPSLAQSPTPKFVYWGRLSPQKGLIRALKLFAEIRVQRPEAEFLIIGPDDGQLAALLESCESLGIRNAVTFFGAASPEEIVCLAQSASFYLQTSLYEGMAMSVVESMQLGLVPVVTAVGEIGAYCIDGHNSVVVGTDEKAVEDVVNLLANSDRYVALRSNAISCWQHSPLYGDSVLNACRELLQCDFASRKGAY